ncbi:MAG: glycoside hydrolase, partial [Candidatus Obscuribacterales bacterium]|nr:glycoside hydrolase [Candidatus Obscuribacterales bacterium]
CSGIDGKGEPYTNLLEVNGPMKTGDSGAVLVDDQYRVVGMLYEIYPDGTANALPIETLREQLNFSLPVNNDAMLHMVHKGRQWSDPCFEGVYVDSEWYRDYLIHAEAPYRAVNAPTLVLFENDLLNIRQGEDNFVYCATYREAWSQDIRLAPSENPDRPYITSFPVAAAIYKGILYCVHRAESVDLSYFTYDGNTWSADADMGAAYSSRYGASLVAWGGDLYCFFVPSDNYVRYCTFDGNAWSQPIQLDYQSREAPSVVSFEGKLCGIYLGTGDDSNNWFYFTYDGHTWSNGVKIAPSGNPTDYFHSTYRPSLVVLNGNLNCFHDNGDNSTDLYYCQLKNSIWSPNIKMNTGDFGALNSVGLAFLPRFSLPIRSFGDGKRINEIDSTKYSVAPCRFLTTDGVKNELFVFFASNDAKNRICYSSSKDGVSWPAAKYINDHDRTSRAPSACQFKDNLYVFWRSDDNDGQMYFSSGTGENWPEGKRINEHDSTQHQPIPCVFNNKLYLFWNSLDASNQIYVSASVNGVTWPHGHRVNEHDYATEPLCASEFNGQLYLFFRGGSQFDQNIYFTASTDGVTWPEARRINAETTYRGVASCVMDGRLYVFWKESGEDRRMYFTSTLDGEYWTPGLRVNDHDYTDAPPSACKFMEKLYVFWTAGDESGQIYFTRNGSDS